jgi:16S rRNA (cytidine1402-2'-O)-methyltransferase
MAGILYYVATPIGNLEDMTFRAVRILQEEADLIAAEDTRHSLILMNHYGIHKPLTSYHDHNKHQKAPYLVEQLKEGKNVALITDAGTPGISDPGYHLLQMALKEGIKAVPIPGVSAVATALSVSGLPTDAFLFAGFIPRKTVGRRKWLEGLKDLECTLVLYESPYRIKSLLEDIKEVMGNRDIVVARELTKKFEEFIRGKVEDILSSLSQRTLKGEFTILIRGSKESTSDLFREGEAPEFGDIPDEEIESPKNPEDVFPLE